MGKTKIFIIGVVHTENEFRNSDSLLKILNDIKPDLILDEGDSTTSFFRKQHLRTTPPWWYSIGTKLRLIRKMPPETEVLFKYRNLDEAVKILPFDKTIYKRKKYAKSYYRLENNWTTALKNALKKGLIPKSFEDIHTCFMYYNNWFFQITQKGYREINRQTALDSIRQMVKIEAEYFPTLFEKVQYLSSYKQWHTENTNHWLLRNETMAGNIINLTNLSKAKQVVILTGLLHKNILKDLLSSSNTDGKYELVEYFEK